MTNIYIDGNGYGYGNIGDDAILDGIIKLLTSYDMANINITVATKNGEMLPFLPEGIKTVKSFDDKIAKNEIAKCDLYIAGGGTLIGDELGVDFPLKYNAKRLKLALKYNKKSILLFAGINKCKTDIGKKYSEFLIKNFDYIITRDKESFNVCNLFYGIGDISIGFDPAYMLKPIETERSKKIKKYITSHGKTIGVNIINEAWKDESEYKKNIATALNKISKDVDYTPIFYTNEVRDGDFFDIEANKEVMPLITDSFGVIIPEYYEPSEMLDIISAFDMNFTMRMHGLIFSSIVETPFCTISRVDKVDNFMKSFNQSTPYNISECTVENVYKTIINTMNNYNQKQINERLADINFIRKFHREHLKTILMSKPTIKRNYIEKTKILFKYRNLF